MQPANLNSQPQPPTSVASKAGSIGSETSGATVVDAGAVGGIAVFSADLQGNITGCSDAALKIFGGTPADLLGRTLTALFSGEDKVEQRQQQKTMLTAVLKDGQYRSSHQCQNKAGKPFSAEFSVTLLRDGKSAPAAMVATFCVVEEKSTLGSVLRKRQSEGEDEPAHTVSREIDGTNLILASPLMHRFMRMVDRVAGHTESVLVTGETGTGKELIARTIHQSSHRRSRPWVDINCAALPENLVESELFGYEKGAFTGADSSKAGLFELADKGTLFLDEIGELQLQTQVKLLRVLDGYPFYRLGGHRKIKVDVRIVAATNQDLDAAVNFACLRCGSGLRISSLWPNISSALKLPAVRLRPMPSLHCSRTPGRAMFANCAT